MAKDWKKLTQLTKGKPFVIERVRLAEEGIAIEGEFELPAIAGLSGEDLTFLSAFVRSHGSIKKMEQYFGISYPTVKNRLNRIAARLEFVEIEQEGPESDTIDLLDKGEIDVQEALKRIKKERGK